MEKKIKHFKLLVTFVIILLFVWFLILNPYLSFKKNEKIMLEAAKRYYDVYSDRLPTGSRIATITLQDLEDTKYVKEDLYVPLQKSACSIKNSWVKVTHSNNGYEYYVYLECGALRSKTDHTGPVITLNGDKEITTERGEEFKDPGVKKVYDANDGEIDIAEVITKGKVDTNEIGTYKVTYTAYDKLGNGTTIERQVKVVQTLKYIVNKDTNNTGNYSGYVTNNYLRFSGMTYQIVGLDGDNIKIVAMTDIANVNYEALDQWLDFYYEHINKESKKYIVKSKYCNDTLTAEEIATKTVCENYTKEKNVHILSAEDINKATAASGKGNWLNSTTMSWVANQFSGKEAWTNKNSYIGTGDHYMSFPKEYNMGVRPLLTIKNVLVVSGDGTLKNPYGIEDIPRAKAGDLLNTRQTGEYVLYSGILWRIVDITNNKNVKVISLENVEVKGDINLYYDTTNSLYIYNPTQKGNIGYLINQGISDSIQEKYFVKEEVTVPIYKTNATYKGETETKKYNVKFHAPDMYDMFSAKKDNSSTGYWLLNASQERNHKYAISGNGTVYYDSAFYVDSASVRTNAYFDKACSIVKGSGTADDPYILTK